MKSSSLSAALVGALLLLAPLDPADAQSQVVSPACQLATIGPTCIEITGTVVFEAAAAAPPAEANIRISYPFGDSGEFLDLRTAAPAYSFRATVPRGVVPTVRLVSLPAPWLSDRYLELAQVRVGRSVELRSDAGIPVTATFQYPQGTVAPPPFDVSVRGATLGRLFATLTTSTGQIIAHVRSGTPYSISAAPQGFGLVKADFPARTAAHAVVVPVDRLARPAATAITIVEGPAGAAQGLRRVLLPIPLNELSPSGGGEIPYTVSVEAGSAGVDEIRAPRNLLLGRRQQFALVSVFVANDEVVRAPRTAQLRFLPTATAGTAAPSTTITLLDDDGGERPPFLSVSGASLNGSSSSSAILGSDASMVLSRAEGGPGTGWTLQLDLDSAAPSGGASVTVSTVSVNTPSAFGEQLQFAEEGADYLPLSQRVVFAAGERSATVRIEGIGNSRPQRERLFFLAFTNASGLAPRDPTIELRIVNDDLDPTPHARADRLPVTPLVRLTELDVLANDIVADARFTGGRLEITQAPGLGTATVRTFGTASVLDDRIAYTPSAGRAGQLDVLRYRLCDTFSEICIAARVEIPIRPVPNAPGDLPVSSEGGFRDIVFSGLPALPDARVELFARRADSGEVSSGVAEPDYAERFRNLWTSPMTLPSVSVDTPRTVLVHLRGESGSDLDLHVAYDSNDDGVFDDAEMLCVPGSTGPVETCVVRFTQRASGPSRLSVGVVNAGATAAAYRMFRAGIAGVGSFTGGAATMPTRIGEGEAFPLRLSWRHEAGPDGAQPIVGQLILRNADGASLGEVPVVLDWIDPRESVSPFNLNNVDPSILAPLPLVRGQPYRLRVPRTSLARDRVFVDVPAGTGSLTIELAPISGVTIDPVEVYLARGDASAGAPGLSAVAAAPPRSAAVVTATVGRVAPTTLVVADPAPGRWYVVLAGGTTGFPGWQALSVTADVVLRTPAPQIRPGGYFHPARSGHGMFVYPAGGDWAGLWYTYTQDGAPVWYYLQAPAPGANGIWTAPIYRSGWNGSRNHLTVVGQATTTPTAADAFQFTYVLDGETGSEPFSSFGRGCPSIGGRVVDASGHWFDPARAGSGYSVQMLPNYEFHAVFGYSARGVPRFLIAEQGGVGAAQATLPLQQLRGFCPLCVRSGDPQRSAVGTLQRTFVDGQLTRMQTQATFTNGTPGTWTSDDAVTPLGGLQGCAP